MIKTKQLFRSFKYALRGIKQVFKTEQSFKLQSLLGLLVILVAFLLPLETWEQVVLIMFVGFVLILELINSVFERLVDSFRSRVHPMVREIKDIMAATVLLASVFATIVGLIILIPHFITWLNS